ncbi:MAG: TetR/AcrR family transcriptional regulator [Anaerovorax sp.]|nr:TetR/AcrR family transcriptional regulator [Anaerovorax sp.]
MGKKEEILNVAHMLFSEKGYNLSMSELSKAVKIKTPSLYSHFRSKEEIVECIVKQEIEKCFSYLEVTINEMEDKKCREKFEGVLFAIFDYFSQNKRLGFWRNISLIQNSKLKNDFHVIIKEKEDYYLDKLKQCVEKGISKGEIKETVGEGAVYLYFTMLQGMMDLMLLYENQPLDVNEYVKKTWSAYWEGIKAT